MINTIMYKTIDYASALKIAKKSFQSYYKTCPLCKGPTTACRMIEGNRECIACTNKEGFGYSFQPLKLSEFDGNILSYLPYTYKIKNEK